MKRYAAKFMGLEFVEKHAVLANLASMFVAVASLFLGIYIFRAQYILQKRQQAMAEIQWLTEHYRQQRAEVQAESTIAFSLATILEQ